MEFSWFRANNDSKGSSTETDLETECVHENNPRLAWTLLKGLAFCVSTGCATAASSIWAFRVRLAPDCAISNTVVTARHGSCKGKRGNTHRSKHSETKQRRRSKINERDLIPQNDQKRDKASFLLEVIEYIQFLQDKLQIYEKSYEGWSQEPTKLIPWVKLYATLKIVQEGIHGEDVVNQNRSNKKNCTFHKDLVPERKMKARFKIHSFGVLPYRIRGYSDYYG
ncbi:hypothetical protein V8G54_032119 [Vigna mungo]|uniref:BHLH domain-containing protein n=1 Tax=Vigna mungo TaxID=3915 RepID=A0AAQ3MKQ7_VIGMU